MMLQLTKVSYGDNTLLNLENSPTNVLLATSEPNLLKFGSSNKSLFDQFASLIGKAIPEMDCSIKLGIGTCTS